MAKLESKPVPIKTTKLIYAEAGGVQPPFVTPVGTQVFLLKLSV